MTAKLVHDIYLKVGTEVYAGVATSVAVPGIEAVVWEGSTDTAIAADVPTGQRKINLEARQDWESAESLCKFLLDNEGEEAEITFSHRPGGTVYFKVTAILSAPDAGGKLNEFASFTKSLPCTKPVVVGAPA